MLLSLRRCCCEHSWLKTTCVHLWGRGGTPGLQRMYESWLPLNSCGTVSKHPESQSTPILLSVQRGKSFLRESWEDCFLLINKGTNAGRSYSLESQIVRSFAVWDVCTNVTFYHLLKGVGIWTHGNVLVSKTGAELQIRFPMTASHIYFHVVVSKETGS